MKSHLRTFSRALFIWTILLVVILSSFMFVILLTRVKSRAIRQNIRELQRDMTGYQKIDTCISILYVAENNSRLFIITQDSTYLRAFTGQLQTVSNILMKFENERASRSSSLTGLMESKREQNDEFIRMKITVDSLLSLSLRKDSVIVAARAEPPPASIRVKKTAKVDSIYIADTKKKKKGLFKRIAEAISNKDDQEVTREKTKTIVERDSLIVPNWLARELDLNRLGQYDRVRRQLNEAERRLLFLNGELFANLQSTLKKLKAAEEEKARLFRTSLLTETSHKFEEVNDLLWVGAIVVLLMTVMIIRNLMKLYRNDVTILKYAALTTEAAKNKGEFLAQITHEIRTPLNSIIGFSQLIDREQLDGQTRESVEAIQGSSRILLTLVNEILDFSKLERGKLTLQYQPFSPVSLLNEAMALLSVLADEKHIEIIPKLGIASDVLLEGDDFRVRQVIMNLLTNAIKFTQAGGKVIVEAGLDRIDAQKRVFKFNIKDSGIGISPEHLDVIFEDFSQVSKAGGNAARMGTGLGLAICKRIVELHGGTISVESTLGKGSEFKVSIPMAVATKPKAFQAKHVALTIPPDFKGKRALVADDTRLNLVLMSRLLEKHGFTYDLVNSGDDALDLFEKEHYDIVITDIHMPGMDGSELTRRIRGHADTRKARTPVVGFTGDSSDRDRDYYAALGINGVLGKPFSENEFITLLAQVFSAYPQGRAKPSK